MWPKGRYTRVGTPTHASAFTEKHLVVYTEDGDERHNRARFTALSRRQYQLGMANHRGILEPTPFTGPLDELIAQLTDEVGFTLVPG